MRRRHTTTTSLASWLRCTHCGQPLAAVDGLTLGCPDGHRFDSNRRGYLSVLDPTRGIVGDPRAILEARARFLALGHYAPIADAVVNALASDRPLSILDSGAGTGYYLQHVLSRSPDTHSRDAPSRDAPSRDAPSRDAPSRDAPEPDALAVDASSAAVAMSVASARCSGLVADVWRPSPVRDDRADAILCVFAPRNAAEFARVLRADGTLVVVTPASDHLAELRAANQIIGMQHDKLVKLDAALASHFTLSDRSALRYEIELSAAAAADLTGMGPSGHHELASNWSGGTTTVSVDVSSFRAAS